MIHRSHLIRAAAVVALVTVALVPAAFAAPTGATPAGVAPAGVAPDYKAADVVKQFATANLGASRAICIGTASECGAPVAAPVAKSFDMLITFGYNSDELTTGARRNLDEFAAALRSPELSSQRFMIEGHTDGLGTDDYNQDLSRRRAASVVRYLEAKGIDASMLVAQGFGKTRPRTANVLDPVNRRVEARLAQ